MLPDFGTSLKKFIFEPNDSSVIEQIRNEIARAISIWEPRIAVQNIEVTNGNDVIGSLDQQDLKQDLQHIVLIKILFTNFDNIQKVEELRLEIPVGG